MSSKVVIDNVSGQITIDGSPITGGTQLPTATEQGQIVISNSSNAWGSQSTNLSFKNRIINGAMTINQRSSGAVSTTGSFPVDRWVIVNGTTAIWTSQQSSNAPTPFSKSILFSITNGVTATLSQGAQITQRIEGFNVADFSYGTAQAKDITLSFWVNSNLTGTYCCSLRNLGNNRSCVKTYTISTSNTWEYKTLTFQGDVTGTWQTGSNTGLRVIWDLGSGPSITTASEGVWLAGQFGRTSSQVNFNGTSGSNFYLTGVQIEQGSIATPFEFRTEQIELSLCQRYYQRFTGSATSSPAIASGVNYSTTNALFFLKYIQPMRAFPTLNNSVLGDNGTFLINQVPVYWAQTKGVAYYGDNSISMIFGRSTAVLTAGAASVLRLNNTGGSAFLDLSAEL